MADTRKQHCTVQCGELYYYQLFFAQLLFIVSPPSQVSELLDKSYPTSSAEQINCHHLYAWPVIHRAKCACWGPEMNLVTMY